jgi:ribosome-associated protein
MGGIFSLGSIRRQGAPVSSTPSRSEVSRSQPARSLELATLAARTIAENQGQEIVILDMTRHTALFDYFVVGTGASVRQLRAIADDIDDNMLRQLNDKRIGREGYDDGRWIILDFGSVVVHLFDADTRAFYSLENMWADAEKVDMTQILRQVG